MANKKRSEEILTNSDKKELENIYQKNISQLQDNINDLLETIDEPLGDMFPDIVDNIQNTSIVQSYDYEREIELLKIEAKETLECLANLYLDKKTMKKKNINSIIKNDAIGLSTLNWSITSTRRTIINAMQQVDAGIADPELFKALAPLQKELRDGVKAAHDLQRKMKDFYKEMRDELTKETINAESEKAIEDAAVPTSTDDNLYILSQSELKDISEKIMFDKSNQQNH